MKLIADNLRITKPMIREALKSRDPGFAGIAGFSR